MATNTMADLAHTAEPDCRELDWDEKQGREQGKSVGPFACLLSPFPGRALLAGLIG